MFSQIEAEKWNKYTFFKNTQWKKENIKYNIEEYFLNSVSEYFLMKPISTICNSDMVSQACHGTKSGAATIFSAAA